MASLTYPTIVREGTLTTEQIHTLLTNPSLLARRIADLTGQKFIADYLLSGRYTASGGGVFYENGEEIFADDAPEAIAPGAEYPHTVLTSGEIAAARTVKWGLSTDVTDEKIARMGIDVVNKALNRLANTVIRHVDSVAMSVITSKVTTSVASAAWTTPGALITALEAVRAARAELGTGLDLSTVVLPSAAYAKVLGMLVDANVLPRENGNPVTAGLPLNAFGFEWVTSPHVPGTDPLLIDRTALGGMADEDLASPEFTTASSSYVQAASTRHATRDAYELRARRVTVPVVLEPTAGVRITGTEL